MCEYIIEVFYVNTVSITLLFKQGRCGRDWSQNRRQSLICGFGKTLPARFPLRDAAQRHAWEGGRWPAFIKVAPCGTPAAGLKGGALVRQKHHVFVLRQLALACAAIFLLGAFLPRQVQAAPQAPAPAEAALSAAPPEVGAAAYAVMDAATGQLLVEKNGAQLFCPASITKILTGALVLELMQQQNVGMEQPVEVTREAVEALGAAASRVGLVAGEILPMGDLLYATQIRSANDAANALAIYWGGSIEGFAALMNAKAVELGLSASHFANPSGLPNDTHVVTAQDMAAITRWALEVQGFRALFGATEYSMAPTARHPGGWQLTADNQMFRPENPHWLPGITGAKTGNTTAAGYTMVTTAARGDAELICVVLYCTSNEMKYDSTRALMDYCFGNFSRFHYADQLLEELAVPVCDEEGQLGELYVTSQGSFSFLLHHSVDAGQVQVEYAVPEQYRLGAPFEAEARLFLNASTPAQCGELLRVPLALEGLDKIQGGAHAPGGQAFRQDQASRRQLGGILFGLAIAALAIAGLAVQAGLQRRQKARLALEEDPLPDVGCWLPQNVAIPGQRPGTAPNLQRCQPPGRPAQQKTTYREKTPHPKPIRRPAAKEARPAGAPKACSEAENSLCEMGCAGGKFFSAAGR